LLAVDHGAPTPAPCAVHRHGQRVDRVATPLSFQQVRNPLYPAVNRTRRGPRLTGPEVIPRKEMNMKLTTAITMTGMAAALLTAPALAQDVRPNDVKQERRD